LCVKKTKSAAKTPISSEQQRLAAEGCGGVREDIQNLSSAIRCNRKKIDNRSQQRNYASARPMINSQQAK